MQNFQSNTYHQRSLQQASQIEFDGAKPFGESNFLFWFCLFFWVDVLLAILIAGQCVYRRCQQRKLLQQELTQKNNNVITPNVRTIIVKECEQEEEQEPT